MILETIAIVLMLGGVAGVAAAAHRSHNEQKQIDFIRSLGADAESLAEPISLPDRVQTPLVTRLFGPASDALRHSLSRMYPSRDIDRVHADLLKAGLTGSVRAEEFVAMQVAGVLMGVAIGLTALVTGVGGFKVGIVLLFVLPVLAGLGPSLWLRQRISH